MRLFRTFLTICTILPIPLWLLRGEQERVSKKKNFISIELFGLEPEADHRTCKEVRYGLDARRVIPAGLCCWLLKN